MYITGFDGSKELFERATRCSNGVGLAGFGGHVFVACMFDGSVQSAPYVFRCLNSCNRLESYCIDGQDRTRGEEDEREREREKGREVRITRITLCCCGSREMERGSVER